MRQEWEPEDLIEVWTLLEEDQERLRNKSGANRLGFALLLKFFEVEARFPESPGEIPAPAVSYVAQQVKVPAEEWAGYDWQGRAIKRHRVEIRAAFGFRECTAEDQTQLAEWLAAELCGVELNRDRLAEAVVVRCQGDRMEPPTSGRIARLVGSAVTAFEERFCAATVDRLSAATRSRLDDLVAEDAGGESQEVSMLALHLLQSALVHVNTLLLSRTSSPRRSGRSGSPTPTGGPCPRCSGPTSTPTDGSSWT
ncbi:DUF4158 domain-containing protein [Streptomyces arboris]|uniref:DUF4158 domain-containing protein n=1 Tax=Streptomyces arboris TaxID=2600619 RepID=UPI003C2E9080